VKIFVQHRGQFRTTAVEK